MTEQPTPPPAPLTEEGVEDAPIFNADVPHATSARPLSDAARRALVEAAERRKAAEEPVLAEEHGGPRGPEPTRYGDWEKKGLAVDF